MTMSLRSEVSACNSSEKRLTVRRPDRFRCGPGASKFLSASVGCLALSVACVVATFSAIGPSAAGEASLIPVVMRSDASILRLPLDQPRPFLVQNRVAPGLLKRRDPPKARPTLTSDNPQGNGDVIKCRVTYSRPAYSASDDRWAVPTDCVIQILDVLHLSFEFTSGSGPVDLLLTTPDGHQNHYLVFDSSRFDYMLPGTSLGTYTFVATAGGRSIRGGYTVERQDKPVLKVRWAVPAEAESSWPTFTAGETINVDMAGYRPGSVAKVYLYRGIRLDAPIPGHLGLTRAVFEYATEIGQFRLDPRGEASFSIPTESNDRLTDYFVLSDPQPQGNLWDWNARFTLERAGHHE